MPFTINALTKYDVSVFVIRPFDGDGKNVYERMPVNVTYGSHSTLIALLKFWSYAIKNKKEIFHLFNTGPFFLWVLKIVGVSKKVYSIHGTVYWKTGFQKMIRKLFWKSGVKTVFTANSEYSGNVFTGMVNTKIKPSVLYNPIDVKKVGIQRERLNELNIIYVGRIVNGKNLYKWIDAANYLLDKKVNAKFELYGSGPLEADLKSRVRELNLENKIVFKGHVERIADAYSNADLVLFLSPKESFGNVAVESILCETPVLVFDIPSMKEIFRNHKEFLIENNHSYCEHIYQKVLGIDELKKQAGRAAWEFRKRFDPNVYIDKLENIYAGLS